MKTFVIAVAVIALSSACGVQSSHFSTEEALSGMCAGLSSTGEVPSGCVKIEGGEIGQSAQTLQLEGASVSITGWTEKSDSAGEQVGFSFTSSAPVVYAVKAGGETYVGTASSWTNPNGTSGDKASAISNITFCPAPPDAPGEIGEGIPVDEGMKCEGPSGGGEVGEGGTGEVGEGGTGELETGGPN